MNCRGFTLVEALISVFLISIGVLAAAPMFIMAMQSNAVGADFGSVGAIAVEYMERVRAEPYDDLEAGGDLNSNVTSGSGFDFFDLSDPDFIVRLQITDNTVPPDTKTIAIRAIAVRQVVGQPKQVTLTTIRGK